MKLFVLGNARSGTTLMSRILGRHPDVHSFNELHFFEEIWSPDRDAPLTDEAAREMTQRLMKHEFDHYVGRTDPARYRSQAEAFLAEHPTIESGLELFGTFLDEVARHNDRSIACTQTPRNVYYLQEILTAYPDAYVIWMVRDPRAVLCSQKHRWRRRWSWSRSPNRYDALQAWMNYHPITYSLIWRAALRAGEAYWDDERVLRVRFEDLVREPQAEVGKVVRAVGLEFSPAMLRVPRRGSSLRPDRAEESGVDAAAADRWRDGCLDRGELYLCERITGATIARHGYRPEGEGGNGLLVLLHALTWTPKASLALLMNRVRTRSSLLSLRRRLGRLI